MKYWMSTPPSFCDTCNAPIVSKFYDAKTEMGPWACMCPECQVKGPGLNRVGTGKGQEYTLQDGKWVKTGG